MKKELLYILAMCSLLAACSKEQIGNEAEADTGILRVQNVVIADAATRAILPTPVTSGTLWVGIRGKNDYTAKEGLTYTYNTTNKVWTSTEEVKLISKPISLYGYLMKGGYTVTDGKLAMATQPYTADKDLVYAASGGENVNLTHPYAGFVLLHQYSRLKVDIAFSANLPTDQTTLESVSVTAGGLRENASLTLSTGALDNPTAAEAIGWIPNTALTSLGRAFAGDMLVVPSDALTDAQLTITISGTTYVADLGSDLPKLEAGKSYLIKAKVEAYVLEIQKVEVENWTIGTSQNEDIKYETDGISVPYNEINLNNLKSKQMNVVGHKACQDIDRKLLSRLIWAPANLMQPNDVVGAKPVFAPSQDAYGSYYDYKQTYGASTDNYTEIDQCSLVEENGGGWRLPSIDELDALARCSDTEVSSFNGTGIKGTWCMNKTNGVFLPWAGSGLAGPELQSGCVYWSNSSIQEGQYPGYAYALLIEYQSPVVVTRIKAEPNSIRCVKDNKHAPEFPPKGIWLSPEDINLTANGCTQEDKENLSKLRWAEGNLKSTGTDGITMDYEWADTQEDYGYYYTWNSSYTGEGNTSSNGVDPCTLLKPDKYGTGWRTPTLEELKTLVRCSSAKTYEEKNGVMGLWCMNKQNGVFLPQTGSSDSGNSIVGTNDGYLTYWSSNENGNRGMAMLFLGGGYIMDSVDEKSRGHSVRCVRDD